MSESKKEIQCPHCGAVVGLGYDDGNKVITAELIREPEARAEEPEPEPEPEKNGLIKILRGE